jgi:hypothetical protein
MISRFPVFAIVFAVAFAVIYVICVEQNYALLTYHPVSKEIEFLTTPPKGGGRPAMYWYGWILTSGLGAAALGLLATLVPEHWGKRIWPGLAWVVPLAVFVVFGYLLSGYFLR